jgi:hypothetical protein
MDNPFVYCSRQSYSPSGATAAAASARAVSTEKLKPGDAVIGPALSGMLLRYTGEHDDVARVAGFGLGA